MRGRATGRGWTEWICFEVFLRKTMLDDLMDKMARSLGVKDDATPLGQYFYPPMNQEQGHRAIAAILKKFSHRADKETEGKR